MLLIKNLKRHVFDIVFFRCYLVAKATIHCVIFYYVIGFNIRLFMRATARVTYGDFANTFIYDFFVDKYAFVDRIHFLMFYGFRRLFVFHACHAYMCIWKVEAENQLEQRDIK